MQSDENTEVLTYKRNLNRAETLGIIKAVVIPLAVFAIAMFSVSSFDAFGTKLICPLSSAMWSMGYIVALIMPSMRKEVINQTLVMLATYYLSLLGFKMLLGIVSGVSSEMISASYNQPIPITTSTAIPGYIQNIMWFTAVLVPVGHISMQLKRIWTFRHNQTLAKTFGRVRSIRKNNTGR